MPDYFLRYQCTFDPLGAVTPDPVYRLEILQKDYSGSAFNVKGGSVPVLHQWQTDDPKAPIKGSSLNITLINEGSTPLTSFYSTEDDTFKVRLYFIPPSTSIAQLLFEGFLVQDDCSETMVDPTHEINLSANDNLGLLKDVALDKAPGNYSIVFTGIEEYSATAPHTLFVGAGFAVHVLVGDQIQIGSDFYTVTDNSGGTTLIVSETIPTISGTATLNLLRSSLLDKITLLTIIKTCIKATGIDLNTIVWGKLMEANQNEITSFLDQTLIDPQTFLKNDTDYEDCYAVLEKVMSRFKMSFFQANGQWNIVRWDELRYYANEMFGYVYDSDFIFQSTTIMNPAFIAGIGEQTVAETGLLRKILRPFQYAKETFNYKQPAQLLRNFNLQTLGVLLNTYTTGSGVDLQTIREYAATWWDPSTRPDAGSGTYFIRVTTDYLDNEIERVLVVTHDVKSYRIEANKDDFFKFSFSFKTEDSQAGPVGLVIFIQLYDGTTTNYLKNDGWDTATGWVYDIPSGDNSNQWHTVEIDSSQFPIPFDGLLYCYLRIADLSGTINETYYRDIRFEYFYGINQSTKIIGHTHKNSQTGIIKQNDDVEIFIDSSPRNSIAGTLFLNTMTGLLQDKTALWQHPYLGVNKKLGDLITWEQLFWRRVPRTILEGTLYGLTRDTIHASLLTVFKYTYLSDLNFVFGTLEIDYKNKKLSGTLWEMWRGNGQPSCKSYTFAGFGFPMDSWTISGRYCDGSVFNFSSFSGDGAIPDFAICARVGSITTLGNIIVTEGESCGGDSSSENDSDLLSTYIFNYLYSPK